MPSKRTIPAKEFLSDLRRGLSDKQLKEKYAISEAGLQRIFHKLLQAKAISPHELEGRIGVDLAVGSHYRQATRGYLLFTIPVYDTEALEKEGWILDITEKGLQLNGIEAEVGQTKSLLIRADEFHDIYPFAFDAVCRWINAGDDQEGIGFEITDISETGLNELRKLLKLLTIT